MRLSHPNDAGVSDMREAVDRVLAELQPLLQADGVQVVVAGIDEQAGVVQMSLAGSCAGCSGSSGRPSPGLERIVADRLPQVRSVEWVANCAETSPELCETAVTL